MPGDVENETTLWKSLVCSAIETADGLTGSETVQDPFQQWYSKAHRSGSLAVNLMVDVNRNCSCRGSDAENGSTWKGREGRKPGEKHLDVKVSESTLF